MTFIFRNMTIFWNISKWNKGKKKKDWMKYYGMTRQKIVEKKS